MADYWSNLSFRHGYFSKTHSFVMTLWFWPLTLNICSVSPVMWWNSVPNLNAVEQSMAELLNFSVWPYDLEHVLRVALSSGIIFTEFDLPQLIRAWIIAFFAGDTLYLAVILTFDPLTLKACGTSTVTWSKSVRNLSEIQQLEAKLLMTLRFFLHT